MGYPQAFHGLPTSFPWAAQGRPMVNLDTRLIHALPMGSSWATLEPPMWLPMCYPRATIGVPVVALIQG